MNSVRWHVIQGSEGSAFARETGAVAVIVDALRASATAAMLFHAGALRILATGTLDSAYAAKTANPDALLFGERGGLPPAGFDYGNSPRIVQPATGKRVILCTTNGTRRLIEAQGACAIYMGSTVNARSVAACAQRHGRDVVLIPAGQEASGETETQEDWVAAAVILGAGDGTPGEGADPINVWQARIRDEGIVHLFETASHAKTLRDVGLSDDVAYCAQVDITRKVPFVTEYDGHGVWLEHKVHEQ